tara:strand:- start:1296 stop:1478 length:183 start_codon:yes stop_codon:yes gene_type:complete
MRQAQMIMESTWSWPVLLCLLKDDFEALKCKEVESEMQMSSTGRQDWWVGIQVWLQACRF